MRVDRQRRRGVRSAASTADRPASFSYGAEPPSVLLAQLRSSTAGLDPDEAQRRLDLYGPNRLDAQGRTSLLAILGRQLANSLTLLLLFAASLSLLLSEWSDALVIFAILSLSLVLGAAQEHRAQLSVAKLRARVQTRARVWRGGHALELPAQEVVVGDLLLLQAGARIAADALLLEAKDLFVDEAMLSGETFPVEKRPGRIPSDAPIAKRSNCVFMGSSVCSGLGRAVVFATGGESALGAIAGRLVLRPPESDFDRGLRRFGHMLIRIAFLLTVVVFGLNLLDAKPAFESLLFAIALAVGIAPEMLPAIVAITLSRGAHRMAAKEVIVKHPAVIEGFGSMDVLCTDKTGTLTEGRIHLQAHLDASGEASGRVLELAALNAALQQGMRNPLDDAIGEAAEAAGLHVDPERRVDEIPYDFVRKRLSVVVREEQGLRLICKGAFEQVLEVCRSRRDNAIERSIEDSARQELLRFAERWRAQGLRVLAVASRGLSEMPSTSGASHPESTHASATDIEVRVEHERALVFEGFLLFSDPVKGDVPELAAALKSLGITLKVISGDSLGVVRHVAQVIGLESDPCLRGEELAKISDDALLRQVERCSLFAEIEPNQKERILLALKKSGHVVGYLGDGINDAPALHAADVGISVDSASDVARDAADIVLLRQDLGVVVAGVHEGRRTFANTLKYLYATQSANFGNMLSMAAASAFLPFLPLTASQILLNNFLSDLPATALAADRVDPELTLAPQRWELSRLQRFMLLFGLTSSCFDGITFAWLHYVARAPVATFRSAWFVESLLSELLVALLLRTRRPVFTSRPAWPLALWTCLTLLVLPLLVSLPWTQRSFAFVELPLQLWLALLGITFAYLISVEFLKLKFYASEPCARTQKPGGRSP